MHISIPMRSTNADNQVHGVALSLNEYKATRPESIGSAVKLHIDQTAASDLSDIKSSSSLVTSSSHCLSFLLSKSEVS